MFTVHGKKYYSEQEYIKARDARASYQTEQEQAVAQYGFCSGYTVLAGEQSERVEFDKM